MEQQVKVTGTRSYPSSCCLLTPCSVRLSETVGLLCIKQINRTPECLFVLLLKIIFCLLLACLLVWLLLLQETWTRAADAGAMCSGSLVEVFRALCSVLEQNQVVLTAQPTYAIMMEASLSKVVLAHVHALEKLCLVWYTPFFKNCSLPSARFVCICPGSTNCEQVFQMSKVARCEQFNAKVIHLKFDVHYFAGRAS